MKANITNYKEIGEILAIDPAGGESTAGILHYKHWSDFTISHYKPKEGENWLKQTRNIENITQNNKIRIIAVETGKLHLNQRYNYHMPQLIKVVGTLEDLADRIKAEYIEISNIATSKAHTQALAGEIAGLKRIRKQGEKGRPREQWIFKDREVNEHEKDAVLVFYVLWTIKLKRAWPFSD